jgi:hypothetical protein
MDVFLTGEVGANLATDWLIENNVFEGPTGSDSNADNGVYLRDGTDAFVIPDGFIVAYNTFGSTGMTLMPDSSAPTANGMAVYGNYFDRNSPCAVPGVDYWFNVTPDGLDNCGGPGAQSFDPAALHGGFVDYHPFDGNDGTTYSPAGDYHLTAGSPLIGAGDPARHPRLDRDGVPRAGTPAVGAYERP